MQSATRLGRVEVLKAISWQRQNASLSRHVPDNHSFRTIYTSNSSVVPPDNSLNQIHRAERIKREVSVGARSSEVREVAPSGLDRTDRDGLSGSMIREKFLKFFEARGHQRLPSSSLIPDDPTVLITIAGMLQFKPIFLGQSTAEYPRATTTQKCVRTNDIENVGRTARHHTFFEMLGNFSFGDYFKEKAIEWAWEISTTEFGLPARSIWISVYEEDDEAFELWKKFVPEERIVRMGKEDNFWAAGPTGPCGPCSELYYDFHPERGEEGVDLNDDSRFIEFYNLVFMEMNRSADGQLNELKNKNIDTGTLSYETQAGKTFQGMGLERMAQILQGVPNNYETDLLFPIIQRAAEEAGLRYESCSEDQKRDLKVIGDHMRAVTYLISDGVVPSNLGRGYVVRRLIRRIVMKGRLLGIERAFAEDICRVVIGLSTGCDPNVKESQDRILSTLSQEEEQFGKTLAAGQKKLGEFIEEAKATGIISGKQAFMLFDTFGFPLEITEEMAQAEGLEVDVKGFEEEMEVQRLRSKSARQDVDLAAGSATLGNILSSLPRTEFLGYDRLEAEGTVVALIRNGEFVEEAQVENGSPTEIEVVLDRTPFYAESGGQIGDKGSLRLSLSGEGTQLDIVDVQPGQSVGLSMHKAILTKGRIAVEEKVAATVDGSFRKRLMCNHTATHLLQSAIKQVLGPDVCQQGSLVAHDRLRFDFNAAKALKAEQISRIESLVNEWIQLGIPLSSQIMGLDEAKEAGAIAMFGEKYGSEVRVITVPGVSMELCGGTHVSNTSELSVFKIVSESAIQSGIRRIEAVAGPAAVDRFMSISKICDDLRTLLKVDFEEIPSRVKELQTEVMSGSKEIEKLKKETAVYKAESLLEKSQSLENGCRILVEKLSDVDGKSVQSAASHLIGKMPSKSAVVVSTVADGRVVFAVAFSQELVDSGLHAGKFVAEVAKICGGGGGGKPNLAQAGGKDAAKVGEALKFAEEALIEKLKIL